MADVTRRSTQEDVGVSVEYHLPLSDLRIDILLFGQDAHHRSNALVVELKQWSDAHLEDEFSENVIVAGHEHPHPSQQALDYAEYLRDYHTAFHDDGIVSHAAAFCHNLEKEQSSSLVDRRFASLLREAPLFGSEDVALLADHIEHHVGCGRGVDLLERVAAGRFKPSRRIVETLDEVMRHDARWHLLNEQRIAYNRIFAELKKAQRRRSRSVIVVRGGPGTGKSVVAVQLLADSARLGFSVAHSTGSKAFTLVLQSKFKGARRMFTRNSAFKEVLPLSLDLLLVDEAHRVRKTSDTFRTPKRKRSTKPQVDELLSASKVTVFLLDENQFVRPDEIGRTALFEEAARRHRLPVMSYDLSAQFRCGGCTEYVSFVDWLLGFEFDRPQRWGNAYRFDIAHAPADLDALMNEADKAGERARLVAGFCWRWSDPRPDGTLIDDVVIDEDGSQLWTRPWNRKEGKGKSYTPRTHPYTLWAETDEGKGQMGCIYSSQGFEFDRVGVVWGNDLVWRRDHWEAQPRESFDRPVKARSANTLVLLKNAYRVLLTRGIRHTRLLCLDAETRAHIADALGRVNGDDDQSI
jgi:hypothetical protein